MSRWGVLKTVGGSTTTQCFHDGLNVVAEYNGNNELQRTYVTPGLDQNLTMTTSGSTYYYLSDALGSIRQLIDANEATQNSYDYEAFGKVYGSPTENVTQPFGFTGRAWDAESSLYYYRARHYAAESGRFAGREPLGTLMGPNLYRGMASNPARYRDPLGLILEEEFENDRIYDLKQILRMIEKFTAGSDNMDFHALETWFDWTEEDYGYYVFTCRCGLVDLRHFFTEMNVAMELGGRKNKRWPGPNNNTADLGLLFELGQWLLGSYSRFTQEDIPSNALGAWFGANYLEGNESPLAFRSALEGFLNKCKPVAWSELTLKERDCVKRVYAVRRKMSPEDHTAHEWRKACPKVPDPCGICETRGIRSDFPFKTSCILGHAITGEK